MSDKKKADQDAWTKSCIQNYIDFMNCGPDDQIFDRWDLPPTRKRRKPKAPTLAKAVKQAKAVGMDVTIAPDGTVTLTRSPELKDAQSSELDQWLAKQHAH